MRSTYDHFLDRAQRLEESRFWAWMISRRREPDWNRIRAGEWLAHDGLDVDQLEAFCLNLRLLIQDRDGISIRSMQQLSETWGPDYTKQREAVWSATNELRTRLSERSFVQLKTELETTKQRLFDVVFYGGLAHVDKEKRDEFERIVNSGLFSAFAFQAFCSVVLHYRNCIVVIAKAVAEYVAVEQSGGAAI